MDQSRLIRGSLGYKHTRDEPYPMYALSDMWRCDLPFIQDTLWKNLQMGCLKAQTLLQESFCE